MLGKVILFLCAIAFILMTLTLDLVYGQRPDQGTGAASIPGHQSQAQYFGNQPGLRTAPASVTEQQDEEQSNQQQGVNENDEQNHFLNFIQEQGLVRQNLPHYQPQQLQQQQIQQQHIQQQLQQIQQLQQQQFEQQRLGIPQINQNHQDNQIQALLQQHKQQQQILLQQLLHRQQLQQHEPAKPLFQQNQQSHQPFQSQQLKQSQLGVVYSPATSVAQTRFTGNGISYSFR